MWGYSSAGRALQWHCRGQRFDPAWLHHPPSLILALPKSSFGAKPKQMPRRSATKAGRSSSLSPAPPAFACCASYGSAGRFQRPTQWARPPAPALKRQLAELTGENVTDAVRKAVAGRLEQERRRRGKTIDRAALRHIQKAIADLPIADDRSPERQRLT